LLLWLSSHVVGACATVGHDAQAWEYLGIADTLAERLNHDRFRPLRRTGRVTLAWTSGDWEGLEARAHREAEDLTMEFPGGASLVRLVEGSVLLARGELVKAEACLEHAAEAALANGVVAALAGTGAALARIALERGDVGAAVERAQRGLDPVAH